MPTPHSSVSYVEPNIQVGYGDNQWRVDDKFDRAPRLEDYCIAMNIEVEVCSRDNVNGDGTSVSDVIILQYSASSGKTYVNFLGGTKIGGYDSYDINNADRKPLINGAPDSLTTYYADLYVGDLINYGTTEMIGIKSVNIDFQKNCVPMIEVVFTDVRGLSLFQPTELNRTNTYNSIKGLSADNVAQSFFQCFFKMPLPKFTFYIKGFYGKPVAYEVMCDKFETNFDQENGYFDINTKFIGYSYSFMTDVSMDVLLAAPLADYIGKNYWEERVNDGTFFLFDKYGNHRPMISLYEAKKDIEDILAGREGSSEETTLTHEESTHEDEINKLMEARGKYEAWYTSLYNVVRERYGNNRCFDFKENGKDGDYYRILILTNVGNEPETHAGDDVYDMSDEYKQFPEEFKRVNDDLFSYVKLLNDSGISNIKFYNTSDDFSAFPVVPLFKGCSVNKNNEIEFNGFDDDCKLSHTAVVDRLFNYKERDENGIESETTNRNTTLKTIYNKGERQLVNGYLIELDYSNIKKRLNYLNGEANKDESEKARDKRRKEINDKMLGEMAWYPTIENFTRIVMAHLETFMEMMYHLAEAVKDRTPESLGITIGKEGIARDVNENSKIVPPFPRVTKEVTSDDGITRREDSWVGEYMDGIGFEEVDIIDSLFAAIERLMQMNKAHEAENELNKAPEESAPNKPLVQFPLTPYDFFLTTSPYGATAEVANDPEYFIGVAAIRMFDILCLSGIRELVGAELSTDVIQAIAVLEARNCAKNLDIKNTNFLNMLNNSQNVDSFNIDRIYGLLTNSSNRDNRLNSDENSVVPWNGGELFDKDTWLSRYSYNGKAKLYPLQNIDFSAMRNTFSIFNGGNIEANNENINVHFISNQKQFGEMINASDNNSCFNNVFISTDYKIISDGLDDASTEGGDFYTKIWGEYGDTVKEPPKDMNEFFLVDGVYKKKIGSLKAMNKTATYTIKSGETLYVCVDNDNNITQINDETTRRFYSDGGKDSYLDEAAEGVINSSFISEVYGFKKVGRKFLINKEKSLFADNQYSEIKGAVKYGKNMTNDMKMAVFVSCIDCIDYSNVYNYMKNKKNLFMYLPNIVVLQLGAALSVCGVYNNANRAVAESYLPMTDSFREFGFKIIAGLNYPTRAAIIKYFLNWSRSNFNEIETNLKIKLKDGKIVSNNAYMAYFTNMSNEEDRVFDRALFNENNKYIKILTNNLLEITLVVKGTLNYNYNETRNGHMISAANVKEYFTAFLEELRVLNKLSDDLSYDNNGVIRNTKVPTTTTEDMKKELYRYLKLLYDKWIPTTPKAAWKYSSFFNEEEDKALARADGGGGHMFHFIDSYYNKIGNRLLVNPKVLADHIQALLSSSDINTMMLGFMADIYAKNKCMLICLQNFIDLSVEGNITKMFTPIAYNDMEMPKKHPDFVVVYPYEPSKNLNVDNGEFNDDSFMLNDELETPVAIKSRGDDTTRFYKIPAFGVSYGKQYQSYFKRVNVNMTSPIATQQSIIAKHSILRSSQNTNAKDIVAQDLYDIYSTQSYTCTVEMMGCSWVQPLMYFVLTNVPMFRGSYMILSVKHHITQGDMTTEFTGCRMANTSNKLIEEIFTDDMFSSEETPYLDGKRNEEANYDNKCPYKVYNLFEDDSPVELSGDKLKDGLSIMNKLIANGFNEYAAAGVVGNMSVESYDAYNTKKHFKYDLVVKDEGSNTSGGLCMWRNGMLIDLVNGKTREIGHNKTTISPTKANIAKYSAELRRIGVDGQIKFLVDSMQEGRKNYLKKVEGGGHFSQQRFNQLSTSEKRAAEVFDIYYERSDGGAREERKSEAEAFYKAYKQSGGNVQKATESKPKGDTKKDMNMLFAAALQKSCNSTKKVNVKLKMEPYGNDKAYLSVKQENGNDKLANVFDIILNGYYEYVQELLWLYPVGAALNSNPTALMVNVKEKPEASKRVVLVSEWSNPSIHKLIPEAKNKKFVNEKAEDFNKVLITSLYKRYRGNLSSKEIPQFTNPNIFNNMELIECCDVLGNSTGGLKGVNFTEVDCNIVNGKIDDWNVKKSVEWLWKMSRESYKDKKCKPGAPYSSTGDPKPKKGGDCDTGRCNAYVKRALTQGGLPSGDTGSAADMGKFLESIGFVKIGGGTIRNGQGGDYDGKCLGDIVVHDRCEGHKDGHINMWCGNKWVSDFKQEYNGINRKVTNTFSIYRYHAKKKS